MIQPARTAFLDAPDEAVGSATPLNGPRITYISWAASCSRSDHTARELGGQSHMVYAGSLGSRPSTILFKYAAQWIRTARILRQERPDIVFVMTPPLFAALPAFWYAWRRGKRVVLDAHTAAFLHPRWRSWQSLQQRLCRMAATTLVHNDHIGGLIRDGGGDVTLVPDVPIVFRHTQTFSRPPGFASQSSVRSMTTSRCLRFWTLPAECQTRASS